MNVGDVVKIVSSPYQSVKAGKIAIIKRIFINQFGPGQHLYELDGVTYEFPNKLFREYEITVAPPTGAEKEE